MYKRQGKNYTVVVTDKVGHEYTSTFKQLGLPSSDFVSDSSKPAITRTDSVTPDYVDSNQNEWVSSAPKLGINVKDDNIHSVKFYLNGKPVKAQEDSAGGYALDLATLPKPKDSRYEVKVVALDKAKNEQTQTYVYYVDSDKPADLIGSISGEYIQREYGNFSKGNLSLNLKAQDGDAGSGVAGYRIIDESGEVISDVKTGVVDLPTGAHYIVAYDKVGNVTDKVSIADLIGAKSNAFYQDSTKPKISVNKPEAVFESWYAKDFTYSVDLKDNLAIHKGTVTVNGVELSSFTANSLTVDKTLTVDTASVRPNEDGSYNFVVRVEDAAGNVVEHTERSYIDRVPPEVTGFTFTAEGYKEGQSIAQDDKYGFYFQGATAVDIAVKDKAPSSGVKNVHYVLRNGDGSVFREGDAGVNAGVARVSIPKHFKGYISATATDNVNNTGASQKPSGIITEDRNWHVNTSSIAINVPNPGHTDKAGNYLYSADTTAEVPIRQGVSGVRAVKWGIGGETLGEATVDNNGNLQGRGFRVSDTDKNLVLTLDGRLPISGNSNDMKIWVEVVDRAGYTSRTEKVVSIDKDKPVISVTYNRTEESGYYNSDRVATVRIRERNFDPSGVKLTGEYSSISSWTNNGNGEWVATVTFSEEKGTQWGIGFTDMAGNVADQYNSETFTIDKTAPQMDISYDNNDVRNGLYYKENRTATVTVVDNNFDPSLVNYSGTGGLSGWSSNGNVHRATATFSEDGDYGFNVTASDKATNPVEAPYDSGRFIIDKTKPILDVSGIKDGVSYKKDVTMTAKIGDAHLDKSKTAVKVEGRRGTEVKLTGNLDAQGGELVMPNPDKDIKNDDLYSMTAVATDLAGNEVKAQNIFSVNRNGSQYSFLHKDYLGKYYQKLPEDVVLHQDSVDQLDMSKYKLVVIRDGQAVPVPDNMWDVKETGGKHANWTYTTTIKKDFFNNNEDAPYQIQTFSQLKDGTKESSMDQEYSFVIDDTKPDIIVSGIESGKTYTTTNQKVTVEVRDLSGPQDVEMTLDGKPVNYTEVNGVYTVNLPANSELSNFSVHVVDKAGNENTVDVENFFLAKNKLDALLNNIWVKILGGVLGLGLLTLLGMLLLMIFKRNKDEDETVDTITSSSGGIVDPENPDTTGDIEEWVDVAGPGSEGAIASEAAAASGAEGETYIPKNVEPDTEKIDMVHTDSTTGTVDADLESTNIVDEDDDKTGLL